MKKIFITIVLFITSISSLCYAEFRKPNEDRWIPVFYNDDFEYWIDNETIKHTKDMKSYSDCYKHRIVHCWILLHNKLDEEHPSARMYMQLDLNCRTTKTNHIIVYDKNNKQVESLDVSFMPPQPVVPESFGEYLVKSFEEDWKENHSK